MLLHHFSPVTECVPLWQSNASLIFAYFIFEIGEKFTLYTKSEKNTAKLESHWIPDTQNPTISETKF